MDANATHPMASNTPTPRPSRPLARFGKWYYRNRFGVLFYSLLFTIAAEPFLIEDLQQTSLMKAMLVSNLIVASVSTLSGTARKIFLVVAALVFLLIFPAVVFFERSFIVQGLGLWSVTAGVAAFNCVRYASRARRIDGRHVYAALSAYLLVGLIFAVMLSIIERVAPGSYSIGGVVLNGTFRVDEAIYFSFVTLSTLGYGDIIPISGQARSFAIVEAIIGQLYLAVLLARIVSLYGSKQATRARSKAVDPEVDE